MIIMAAGFCVIMDIYGLLISGEINVGADPHRKKAVPLINAVLPFC